MVPIRASVPLTSILADTLQFRLLTVGVVLAGALLAAAVVIALVSRWRRRAGTENCSPAEQLAQFRSLYEAGAISQEEFERLRTLLGAQLREEWRLPLPSPGAADQPPGSEKSPGQPPDTNIRPAPSPNPLPPGGRGQGEAPHPTLSPGGERVG